VKRSMRTEERAQRGDRFIGQTSAGMSKCNNCRRYGHVQHTCPEKRREREERLINGANNGTQRVDRSRTSVWGKETSVSDWDTNERRE
jgi:hypothetical protein